MAGIAAAGAIALALWDRRRSGRGQYVEVAQRENLINMIGEQVVAYSMTGREPPRRGNRDSSMAPHGCYPCRGDAGAAEGGGGGDAPGVRCTRLACAQRAGGVR